MRAVVQRLLQGRVEVQNKTVSQIDGGLLVYVSVGTNDTINDAEELADKLVNLRIFPDEAGKMNRSTLDIGSEILLISNFTLHGDCRKGRRPSFDSAVEPAQAQQLYEKLIKLIKNYKVTVKTGIFSEHMHVVSTNDGPVTFLLDSSRLF